MSLTADLRAYGRLRRAPWMGRTALRQLQEHKLRRLVQHAYDTVPFYRDHFDAAGVAPQAIRTQDDLALLPVVTKQDMLQAGPDAMTSRAFRPGTLRSVTTSGSSGQPFTIRCDPHWQAVQRALFVRALVTAGYRPGRRLLVLGESERRLARWRRWQYVRFDQAPARVLEEWNRWRPSVVYGWVSPLREMARYAQEAGHPVYAPQAVVTTAEGLDRSTRAALEASFGAPVFDVYGLTEMGIIACECRAHAGYHLAEDTVIAEWLEPEVAGGARRLVLTNLDLWGTPFLRYDTGDLAAMGPPDACSCGRTFARLGHIDGRSVDCVQLRDGRVILPYQLTLELEHVAGLRRYQVIQNEFESFTVRYETGARDSTQIEMAVRRVLMQLLGSDADVRLERHTSLTPPAGRKFRVVECHLPTAVSCI